MHRVCLWFGQCVLPWMWAVSMLVCRLAMAPLVAQVAVEVEVEKVAVHRAAP